MTGTEYIEGRLGYIFVTPKLLEQALTHPSAGGINFQRLEFLGDRVLGLVIAEWLYFEHPDEAEGDLAKRFIQMVQQSTLNNIAGKLNLARVVKRDSVSSYNTRIMADACEAIIGAIYLDGGISAVQIIIKSLWKSVTSDVIKLDAKTDLQEYLQSLKIPLPSYEVIDQKGFSHAPIFFVKIEIDKEKIFFGQGKTKRQAEQQAAQQALNFFQQL